MRRLTGSIRSVDGDERIDIRETYRTQLIASIGGWQGTLIAALPPVIFVIVNTAAGLRPAIIAAIATGALLTTYRLARRQSVQQALSGLFAVLIAALIAARTGQARGYFLLGIWQSFVYAVPFAVSVVIRRPLVGLIWEFLDPTPGAHGAPWYRRRGLLWAYTVATLVATVLFLSRGLVQLTLYGDNATGWLAVARIAMGYPLSLVAVGLGWWVVRRARARLHASALAELGVTEPAPDVATAGEPDQVRVESADDGAADRGLGLG